MAELSRLVYLAGPIDQVVTPGEEGKMALLRAKAHEALGRGGLATYDPSLPFTNALIGAKAVVRINTAAIDVADGMLAFLPAGVGTIGTPAEIMYAHDSGKPVVVVTDVQSVQLKGSGISVFSEHNIGWAVEALRQMIVEADLKRQEAEREADGKFVVWWTGEGEEPKRAYPGDAGFDLTCSVSTAILPGEFYDVPCAVSVELPEGVWGMITGRSSTLRKKGLLVPPAIIDQGYRGELFANVWNLADHPVKVEKGERIAQLVLLPVVADLVRLERAENLTPARQGERGTLGFGSTGV